MKIKQLALFVLFTILFSCKDDNDSISPYVQVEGKYLSSYVVSTPLGDIDYVHTLEFKSDGTLYGEDYATESGKDEILGYTRYYTGTYTIKNDILTLRFGDVTSMYYENDVLYLPKEDLRPSEGQGSTKNYSIHESYSQLTHLFICDSNVNCAPPEIYVKVD